MKSKIKIPFEWIEIAEGSYETTERAKILGGWLVKHDDWSGDTGNCISMIFISDPEWQWEI